MIFGQPTYLWGLLAIAIPIAIHLLNLRRYHKVYFSNVEKLSELHIEQRRRNNLKQWLLLASRILAVFFIVMAFAKPFFPKNDASIHSGSTAVSIYIDNSYSMDQASSEGSVLDQACKKACEVAAAYSATDRFQLLTNDMHGSQMRLLDRDELVEAINAVQSTSASVMLSTVVHRQHDFLNQSHVNNRHAYLISDFQRSTADIARLPIDSNIVTTLVPLQGVKEDNVYIDTVVFDAPSYHIGSVVNLEVSIANSGQQDAASVPVRLVVDGQERAVATVDVPADGMVKNTLRFSINHAGNISGSIQLDDYPITYDDRYHFSLRVGNPIHILELDGNTPNENLRRLFSGDSLIHLTTSDRLQYDLSEYDLVILNESTSLASGDIQMISQWTESGGSLLIVPAAERTEMTDINLLLSSLKAPQLGSWRARPVKAKTVNTDAALYRGVFSGKTSDMEMPVVQGHYRFSQAPCIAESLIELGDDTPLLSSTIAGSGIVYLFTAPLHAESNSLVEQALFVPTLFNMALYSHPLPPPAHTLGNSNPITLQDRYDIPNNPPSLITPNGQELIPDIRRVGNRQVLIPHGELKEDGVCRLVDELLAFNHSRLESTMDFLTKDELAKALKNQPKTTLIGNTAKPLTTELQNRFKGHQVWRLCLLLALLMLGLETILTKLKR